MVSVPKTVNAIAPTVLYLSNDNLNLLKRNGQNRWYNYGFKKKSMVAVALTYSQNCSPDLIVPLNNDVDWILENVCLIVGKPKIVKI